MNNTEGMTMSNKYPNLIRWADWLDNIYPGQEGNNDESESVQFLLHFCSDEDARIAMMCEPFFKSLDEIAEANNVTVEEIASTLEEMEMKMMTCITICTIVNLIWVESSHDSSCYSCNILKVSSSLFCS